MKRLLKFARLSSVEKFFFLRAFFYMGYYRLSLKITPLQKLLEQTRRKGEQNHKNNQSRLTVLRTARLVNIAGNIVPLSTCLSKTLAGHILFAEQGYRTKIHIGVAKDQEAGFEAHAWLTYNDIIVVGSLPDLQKYKELPF